MAEIRIKDNESLDSALRRFKKQCARAGVIAEVRKREAYEKPSVKRKKKSEAARKRKFRVSIVIGRRYGWGRTNQLDETAEKRAGYACFFYYLSMKEIRSDRNGIAATNSVSQSGDRHHSRADPCDEG